MRVTVVAKTGLVNEPESIRYERFSFHEKDKYGTPLATDADVLSEFAGRSCYQSWGKPNPKTASNEDYLANIVTQEHFSVMEHASVTFYVEGVSRALTHELIRHRHLSYSELSQRYVDMSETPFIVPPALRHNAEGEAVIEMPSDIVEAYDDTVAYLVGEEGLKNKQAREAARAFLPNATETKIVVTGNLRAWRDFLKKRWHVAADAEIREFAGRVLDELRVIAPNTFADVPTVPYGTEYAA